MAKRDPIEKAVQREFKAIAAPDTPRKRVARKGPADELRPRVERAIKRTARRIVRGR